MVWKGRTAIEDGSMNLFPMFLKLEGRRCLVVGAGKVGESKIRSLLTARARVHVVAPRATPSVVAWERAGVLSWRARPFEPGDLDGVFLVVAATSFADVNDSVYLEARRRQVLCNVVDDPERCDFFYPAVVRRGDLQVAISTAGKSPALAQRLRKEFERQLAPIYAGWLQSLGRLRQQLFAGSLDSEVRRSRLHAAASRGAFEAYRAAKPASEERRA
jgi:precorrin-2 dehydrogenase / sirohydrochlorin ferrochelatase